MTDWHELVREGRFEEAQPLMLEATSTPDGYCGETVTRADFYEQWGDSLGQEPIAGRMYWTSHGYWATFASWATSGGEGTARMLDVNRVLKKLEPFRSE